MTLDADIIYGIENLNDLVNEYADESDDLMFPTDFEEISCEFKATIPRADYTDFLKWAYNEYPCRIKRWKP